MLTAIRVPRPIFGQTVGMFAISLALIPGVVGVSSPDHAWGTTPAGGAAAQSTDTPVRLVVATDHEIRNDREWARGLALVVAEAEDLLYPYLGRPLEVVRTAPWQGSFRQPSADPLLQDLMRSVSREDADIVVGFARSYSFQPFTETGARARGLANYRSAYAVLMLGGSLGDDRTPVSEIGSLLAHELAHVFGAVHRSGADLLLAPGGVGTRIDALSAALIGMHRERSFGAPGFPLPAHYREAARPLYRKAIEDDPGNLDARLMLARLDVETGRFEEAVMALEEILSEFPGSLEARADLDLALSLRHRESGSSALALGSPGDNVGESPRPGYIYQRKVGACS